MEIASFTLGINIIILELIPEVTTPEIKKLQTTAQTSCLIISQKVLKKIPEKPSGPGAL